MAKNVSSILEEFFFFIEIRKRGNTPAELSGPTCSFASSFILIYTHNVQRLWAAIYQKSFASALDGSSESAHHRVSAIAVRQHEPACLLSLEVNEVMEYNLEMHVMSNKHFFLSSGTSLLPCNMTRVTGVNGETA